VNLDLSNAVHYREGQFPPAQLNVGPLLPRLLAATDALARYDQALQAMHNSAVFLAPLRGQEAVVSSRMEGTISTMDEILQLEAEYEEDEENAIEDFRSDAIETALYRRALNTAQRQLEEGRPLSESLIKSVHQHLLSFGRGARKSPGTYKREQNYVGERGNREVRFVPIAPEHLASGMERLFQVIEDQQQPILLRTALAHAEFEALHPFEDGNGRVGRMLITLMLWRGEAISAPHFYISRYFEEHKDEYIDRLRDVSSTGEWEGWCSFFLEAVKEQALQNLQVAQDIRDCYEEMKLRFADLLASRHSVAALDYMFNQPIFANSRFTRRAGIPLATAGRFSRLLLKEGLLEVVRSASGRRSAVYRFEPLMKLVRI